MTSKTKLSEILSRHTSDFAPVIAPGLRGSQVCRLDFTAANTLLQQTDLKNTEAFNEAVNQMLQERHATIGVGGYFEDRFIYRRSQHFDVAAESRNLHLGIDVWTEAETPVCTPLDAVVHSFQDNDNFGDYGPTIILQHELEGVTFYTLYGHLSRASLEELEVGKEFRKGDRIAWIGNYPENGNWPPHLHFQVMTTMEGRSGDFPGVAAASDRAHYEQICPNPNLILQCPLLPM